MDQDREILWPMADPGPIPSHQLFIRFDGVVIIKHATLLKIALNVNNIKHIDFHFVESSDGFVPFAIIYS
jgi:hypothetical protein